MSGGGGGDYEPPRCCGVSTGKLNAFSSYTADRSNLKAELVSSVVFFAVMTGLTLYLVVANSLTSILESVEVANPSHADVARILATQSDAVCPCSNQQFSIGSFSNFSYTSHPFCEFGADNQMLYTLTVDHSPLLNSVYVSLLTICGFLSRSLATSLTTLRSSSLTATSAFTAARLQREVANLVSVASTTGQGSALQIIQAELFPPLLEGAASNWAQIAWPLITNATGHHCSDFRTAQSIRDAPLWYAVVPVNVTASPTDHRGNLSISCTAMTSAAQYVTASQLAFGDFLTAFAATNGTATFTAVNLELTSAIDFDRYLDECAVQTCRYTQTTRQSALTVVTVVFGLLGGLSVALKYPFALVLAIWKHYASRPSSPAGVSLNSSA